MEKKYDEVQYIAPDSYNRLEGESQNMRSDIPPFYVR